MVITMYTFMVEAGNIRYRNDVLGDQNANTMIVAIGYEICLIYTEGGDFGGNVAIGHQL